MELNKKHLTQDEFEITQNCGTEPPFSGKLLYEKKEDEIYAATLLFSNFSEEMCGPGFEAPGKHEETTLLVIGHPFAQSCSKV